MSTIPSISHLQIAILSTLEEGEKLGQVVRDKLAAAGVRKSGPAFYQLMARLEEAGLVEGWYTHEVIAGQPIKQRCYKRTGLGSRVWRQARDFYLAQMANATKGVLAHG